MQENIFWNPFEIRCGELRIINKLAARLGDSALLKAKC